MRIAAMVTSLEFDMPKVFHQVGANDAGRYTGLVLDILKVRQTITKQELFREFVGKISSAEIDSALQGLIIAGYVSMRQEKDKIMLTYNHIEEKENAEESLRKVN